MREDVNRLMGILELEPLEENLYRGTGAGGETSQRIFGGQVIAQALRAAYHTVPEDRFCHSLHAYFIRAGDLTRPVIYEVDRARDGGSFTTRRVVAIQHGKQILNLSASFHKDEEGHSHQTPMPANMPDPETLETRDAYRARIAAQLPEKVRAEVTRSSPIELRETDPGDPLNPEKMGATNAVWFRLSDPVEADRRLQHCLLAYASDLYLLGTSVRAVGESFLTGRIMVASIDHAMWFHRPFDFSNWHLYAMESHSVGGGRGFNRGAIYAQDGTLVASSTQEGLMRPVTQKA
ncbi:MAG: acyl-CoA thioesterase II [Rhodobacterales bacterium]|nr:MAG: acyl-CoA thioesterase II [Rhodobacterales bacterium]